MNVFYLLPDPFSDPKKTKKTKKISYEDIEEDSSSSDPDFSDAEEISDIDEEYYETNVYKTPPKKSQSPTRTYSPRSRPSGLSMRQNKTIVLDMDECLLHMFIESDKIINFEKHQIDAVGNHNMFNVMLKNSKHPTHGVYRPMLREFLNYCYQRFANVILWSAGADDYVDVVAKHAFTHLTNKSPTMILSRKHCKQIVDSQDKKSVIYTKPLVDIPHHVKINGLSHIDEESLELKNIIFVDDNPGNSVFNVYNHVLIPEFSPAPNVQSIKSHINKDKALIKLMEWLEKTEVKNSKDIRQLDTNIFKLSFDY